jgi:hypothetical protein
MSDSDESDRPIPPPPPAPSAPEAAPSRKDRLVQTRVPRELEDRIKEEAGRRRLTVSHLVRNLLEDAVDLVDNVLGSVDDIVSDSVDFAENVGRDIARATDRERRRRGGRHRSDRAADSDAGRRDERAEPARDPTAALDHVAAWNAVILNRSTSCSACEVTLERGDHAYAGLGSGPIAWLCDRCIEAL